LLVLDAKKIESGSDSLQFKLSAVEVKSSYEKDIGLAQTALPQFRTASASVCKFGLDYESGLAMWPDLFFQHTFFCAIFELHTNHAADAKDARRLEGPSGRQHIAHSGSGMIKSCHFRRLDCQTSAAMRSGHGSVEFPGHPDSSRAKIRLYRCVA
jgi:hypothetical protein